jgi:hypothetical protein
MKSNLTRSLLKNKYVSLLAAGFEDFTANKCAEIISGHQPYQCWIKRQRFRYFLWETLVLNSTLTLLIARKYFSAFLNGRCNVPVFDVALSINANVPHNAYTSMFQWMQLFIFFFGHFIPFHNMFRPQSAIIRCYCLPKLLTLLILIVHIHVFFYYLCSIETTPLLHSLNLLKVP